MFDFKTLYLVEFFVEEFPEERFCQYLQRMMFLHLDRTTNPFCQDDAPQVHL